MTQPSQVIERLSAIRRTIRRRLIAYGACVVAMGGVAAFLTIVTLDWLLWLPTAIRMLVAGVFLAGFVGATRHWIVRPLLARLELGAVAARLERHFGALDDRLISTVNFLDRGDAGSATMMRQVIANTERILTQLPLESALSLKPLIRRIALTTVTLAALVVMMLTSNGWVQTGLYRYLYPWGELQWPRSVSIQPMTGDRVVAIGESVTVRMAIVRGLTDTLRGVVHVREPGGSATRLAMRRDDNHTFQATIDTITSDLEYWFEAGDDETKRTPFAISTVPRPEVIEALAEVQPPPYARQQKPRVEDLADGPVHAPVGGRVRVTVRSSKPVVAAEGDAACGLRTDDGELIPLLPAGDDDTQLTTLLTVASDLHFRIELRDEHGFENRGAKPQAILATPDAPPVVAVIEPPATVELTPRASLPLLVRVEDDFGVMSLALESEVGGRETGLTASLSEELVVSEREHGVEAQASYVWDIERLGLAAGDVVSYSVVATDNHRNETGEGQTGRSAVMHVKIISDAEFDARVRSDLALLEARIRETALAEADLLDRTSVLLRTGETAVTLTAAERDLAATLAAEQARLIRRLGELGRRFRRLVDRMERNESGDAEMRGRLSYLIDSLQRVAATSMTTASTTLSEASSTTGAAAQQQRVAAAVEAEEASVDDLRTLLHSMADWGSFRELVTKTRDLLDRQNQIRQKTVSLGKETLGQSIETLNEDDRLHLKRVARQQEQLGGDVERLLERMRATATEGDKDDSTGTQAIEDALRIARALDLSKHLQTSLEGITENRTAAAAIAQQAAAEAMRKMEAALKERENRQLEALRKRLEEARDQVAFLIEHQEAVQKDTREAGMTAPDDDVWRALNREQHTVRGNTRSVADELADMPDNAAAARLVRQSTRPMGEAERHLRDADGSVARADQDEALALLGDALNELEVSADETADELFRRTLAQIREMLQAVLAAQQDVNVGVAELVGALQETSRVDRRQARTASKLARSQAEVLATLNAELATFEKVVVYRWALERISAWMLESRDRLTNRRLDDELVNITDRIARELEKLITAIQETENLPMDTQFVETESGGGGGDGGSSKDDQPPVPTVAELLVLKAMQVDINNRTASRYEALDMEHATEAELRGLKNVADDQKEVRRLTELVTQRAAQP